MSPISFPLQKVLNSSSFDSVVQDCLYLELFFTLNDNWRREGDLSLVLLQQADMESGMHSHGSWQGELVSHCSYLFLHFEGAYIAWLQFACRMAL